MKSASGELSGSDTLSPIAITGIGCRFPGGVSDLDAFGRLLSTGGVIREVPGDRWSPDYHDPSGSRPGTTISDVGSFVDDIDRFDAAFFGISPREAAAMDPQQRMLLEVCWEAMADSGRRREDWSGSRTAVFTGMLAGDYATLHAKTLGTEGIGTHYASGVEASFAAGRIGYVFDLHGPVATISSACSSALLSVHLAAQSLRSGECDAALAGGVNLLLTPELSVFMSGIGAVSPTGSCRPFEAAANGVVRGEGCAFVVLRRLDDALADGDRIHAVIRGSAVNHDGTSLALTAPNGAAQRALLATALDQAGLRPQDVDFVEAHGTATPLGDHIELSMLAETYGTARPPGRPLLVGSHKAVLGHTDAAAGVAGLLKAVWVVSRRRVPAQPGLGELTPVVDWDTAGLAIPDRETPLEGLGRPVRAGVSAFGLSGTNVHAIVEEAPEPAPPPSPEPGAGRRGPYLLVLSAGSQRGLAAQGERMAALATAARDQGTLDDLVASAATRRTHGPHRRAIVAADAESLLGSLACPGGDSLAGVVDPDETPVPVFVFSGQGSQWPGMAADLLAADPAFAGWIEECDALIRQHADWSLMDELRGADGRRLARTDIAQPAIFAIQVAVTRWLADRGIRPEVVIGHSAGEIAAAHAAGALSLPDAIRLVVLRGELLHETAGQGRMAAAATDSETAERALREAGSAAVVAAVNGPSSVVLSGPAAELTAATRLLTEQGIRCVPLPVEYAFHSPVVADRGPVLRERLDWLEPSPPTTRLLSSVRPDAEAVVPDAAYWERNLADPVRIWPAVDRLLAELPAALIEIGPHSVLTTPLADAVRSRRRGGPVVPTLRRGKPGQLCLHRTLAALHVVGLEVDFGRVTGRPARYRTLPVPSWDGDRYWLPGVERGQQGRGLPAEFALPGETLPGETLPGETLPGGARPGEALPGQMLPGGTAPRQVGPSAASASGVTASGTSANAVPANGTSGSGAAASVVTARGAVGDGGSADSVPAKGTPAYGASGTGVPASAVTAGGALGNGASAGTAPANGGPAPVNTGPASPVPASYVPASPVPPAGGSPVERVTAAVRQVLGFREDQRVPRTHGLFEIGLDSAGAVQLRGQLEADFGVSLASTVVFEHPTINELASYLAELAPAKILAASPHHGVESPPRSSRAAR